MEVFLANKNFDAVNQLKVSSSKGPFQQRILKVFMLQSQIFKID